MIPTKQQLGFRGTSSNAIFYGPQKLGVFELPSLVDFQEKQHLRMLCDHLCTNDHGQKAISYLISMIQLESGCTIPVLYATYKFSTRATEGWLKEHWRILDKYGNIHQQCWWAPPTLRVQDQGFTQLIADSQKFQPWQLRQINRCHIFLRKSYWPCLSMWYKTTPAQSLSRPTIPVENSTYTWPQQECPAPRYWRSAFRMLINFTKTSQDH